MPIYKKSGWIMRTEELIENLKRICDAYSDILGTVILFGSYSRNEAEEDSDIDLYIEPKDRSVSSTKFGVNKRYKDFKFSLYDTFSRNFDLLVYGGTRELNSVRKSPLWKQIEKDGILIYEQGTKVI